MDLTIAILIYDEDFYETYVRKTLSSIKHNLKNYKTLLLVDDRRDQNVELDKIFDLSEFNYEIAKHNENKGILQGYLTAINNSKTEYLWILDQDDWVTKFDFDILRVENKVDFIYFQTYLTKRNKCDKHVHKANLYTVFLFRNQDNKFKNIPSMTQDDKQFILTFRTDEEKMFIYKYYEGILPAFWNKIVNVEFCKNRIKRVDFSKFGKLTITSDVLLSLYLIEDLRKVMITFYDLPYIHDERNLNKYNWYYNKIDVPNIYISDDVKKSWKVVYDNSMDVKKIFRDHWKDKLIEDYGKCNVDFNLLGIK